MTEIRRIQKLLIANRGEIAARIQRTCASMGIETVAVFSDADADAPYVRRADEAVRIGPPPSAESYLDIDAVIGAAKRTGADAIHPGFGFLAENADFAQAVADAGLIFVGPSPDVIRSMGSKQRAKQIARDAGIRVIEGYDGADQDALADEAMKIGFPILVKASAGGGGKGMRVVRGEGELSAAIESARREAESSFGDGTLIIEKYIERPRHIEIQILGDEHGNLFHLGERECSIQRRHQKIVEEAPSVAVTPELRARMAEAALKIAEAIGYTNAGTVEMILDPDDVFYFLEVNTRLQVEHPVTEAITEIDIVELQIRVAAGEELPLDQEILDDVASGAAIEVRLYAEDPAQEFLPQSGRVLEFEHPEAPWLRVDAGIESGTEVSIHYDPMLAKIIVWGPTRADAIKRMRWVLRRTSVLGLRTNRDFLLDVIEHPAFAAGDLHTHFVEEHLSLNRGDISVELASRAALAVALRASAERDRVLPSLRRGFRNNPSADQEVTYLAGETEIPVRYTHRGGDRYRVGEGEVRVEVEGPRVAITDATGHRYSVRVVSRELRHHVLIDGRTVVLDEVPRFPDRSAESAADGAVAPMPGQVVKLLVSEGELVTTGQTLAIMEAMKMEHSIAAPHDGVVVEVCVTEGQQVDDGAVLVVVKAPPEASVARGETEP